MKKPTALTDDLLITTPSKDGQGFPIGIAGVIAGLHHSIKPNTTSVALEIAHFEPTRVRRTAQTSRAFH
ncbi:MAG: phenylalanine--tRNA ligase beta subunit-related protein [Deinococcales bacterium]